MPAASASARSCARSVPHDVHQAAALRGEPAGRGVRGQVHRLVDPEDEPGPGVPHAQVEARRGNLRSQVAPAGIDREQPARGGRGARGHDHGSGRDLVTGKGADSPRAWFAGDLRGSRACPEFRPGFRRARQQPGDQDLPAVIGVGNPAGSTPQLADREIGGHAVEVGCVAGDPDQGFQHRRGPRHNLEGGDPLLGAAVREAVGGRGGHPGEDGRDLGRRACSEDMAGQRRVPAAVG
jgi:hypothetical protein